MNKVTRKKNENYTTISNVYLRDIRLSLKAKGFLTVVMSLPDTWDFSIKGICKVLKEGTTAVYNTIDELKTNGYCEVTSSRDDKGMFLGNDYIFFEEPHLEEPNKDYPYAENPNMDNGTQISKEEKKALIEKKKERNDYPDDFEEAFALYRRKGNKKEAYVEWKKLDQRAKEMVFKHIPHYVAVKELCYQKDFVRYLKNNLYMDIVYDKNIVVFDPNADPASTPNENKGEVIIGGITYR